MVKLKRVYDPPSGDDGKRVLVDRLWPRGVRKETARVDDWQKDIAPTEELRRWFSHDTSKWQEFRKRYVKELALKEDLVARLRAEAGKENLTLLFAAKDTEHNNAIVLKEVIEKEDS